jgi:hypothetical protein
MSEEHEDIERKTPRELVSERFSFRDMRQYMPMMLTFPERDVAVLLPHKAAFVAIHCFMIVFGVMSWGFGGFMAYVLCHLVPGFEWITLVPLVIFGIEGLVVIWLGLAGVMGKRDDGRIVFDRRQGVIVKKARNGDPFLSNDMRIRNVAAVQICSGIVHGSEGDITRFQLNLVLLKPAGERIRVVNRMKEEAVRADARQLAKFLDVSLWDHLVH